MRVKLCRKVFTIAYALYLMGRFFGNAEIYRYHCRGHGFFQLVAQNARLDATVIDTIVAHTLLMCSMNCINDFICKSINYNANEERYEKLSGNRLTDGEMKLIAASAWEYYEPEEVESNCDKHPAPYLCNAFQKCVEDFAKPKGYRCVGLQNIALGKATVNKPNAGVSSRAVDGNSDSYFYHSSCTHTACCHPLPWWRVDFGSTATVYSMKITNRGDCCGSRLSNFNVRVGDSNVGRGEHNKLCQQKTAVPQGQTSTFICIPKVRGRYLYIQTNLQEILTLCEVEVFGDICK